MEAKKHESFRMDQLFSKFERGKVHSQSILPDGDEYFYVGAKKYRCGVMAKCGYEKNLISKGNCIIFICNGEGSVGFSNYMDRDFMASGDLLLAYGDFINPFTALYLITMLDLERPKYSFGRKYGKYVKGTTIPLPINREKTPDWVWIEEYVKNKLINKLPTRAKSVWEGTFSSLSISKETLNLNDRVWAPFMVADFCDKPYKAKAYNAIELQPCSSTNQDAIPYITRTEGNNGCKFYVQKNDAINEVEEGNAITIGDTTATVNYQEKEFICGDHMVILRSPYFNKYIGFFIVTLLNKERFRYNYGRAFNKDIIANTVLRLPVALDSFKPDWQFIENYMKRLSYSANI